MNPAMSAAWAIMPLLPPPPRLPDTWGPLNIMLRILLGGFPLYPGRFFLLGITVICLPWKRVSFKSFDLMKPSIVSNSIYANLTHIITYLSLPFRLPWALISRDSDPHDVTTLLEMLFQILRRGLKMHVLDENRPFIRIFRRSRGCCQTILSCRFIVGWWELFGWVCAPLITWSRSISYWKVKIWLNLSNSPWWA